LLLFCVLIWQYYENKSKLLDYKIVFLPKKAVNTALFIARHLWSERGRKSFTGIIRVIAILSISLGLGVMIIAMAVVTGFQSEIRNKVIGFGSHIQISNFDFNLTAENNPINKNQDFIDNILSTDGIRHVQMFATKAGILKTEEDIHGVVLKGVGSEYDWTFFTRHLISGQLPDFTSDTRSDEIMISGTIARLLKLNSGDDVFMYFIQDPPRIRRFSIASIYDTGLEELDRIYILGDIRHVQRLNDWSDDLIGGFEILVDDYKDIPRLHREVFEYIPYDLDAKSIRQVYPQIFDWLALLDMNVIVILSLMLLVAAINMITNLIGILKALGSPNLLVRRVFLYSAAFLIVKGLIFGNILGLTFSWLQHRFGIIKLSQESYYVSEVPINIVWSHILLLNLGTFTICMAMLVIPSMIVTRISPVKAISFR
jgi:lipoprotein-releasing system permease protein